MLRLASRVLSWIVCRLEVRGGFPEKFPARSIIVANHQSFIDGMLLQALAPAKLHWVVHSTAAPIWYFRLVLRLIPHLLVDVTRPMAMKRVVEWIEQGHTVVIFPEGRITTTGSLMKTYEGPAFLAVRTAATLIPVYIDGAVNTIFARLRKPFPIRWRPRVRISFFPPRRLDPPEARTGRERRRLATTQLHRLLQQMRFEAHPRPAIFDAFLETVKLYGRSRPILADLQREYTYGTLLKGSLALGRLTSRITEESEYVGVLMPNVGATVMLIFGLLSTRRIPAMINYTAGVDGMRSACRLARVRTVVTSRAFLEKAKLEEKVARLEGVRLVYLEDLRASFGLLDKLWLILWALRGPRAVTKRCAPDEPAVVLFTSGSEGKPKGVVLSHGAIMANIAQIRAIIEFSILDKFLAALPLFHTFGLTGGLFLPLIAGARVHLYPSPLHYRLIPEAAYDYDCTVLFATPTFLGHYGRFANPYDFYRLRYVMAGAEKLTEEVRRLWMDKFGIRVLEGYGVTECAPVISAGTPMAYRPRTVGVPVPGMETRLEPVAGLDRGGALHVRGPNLFLGYLSEERPGEIVPPSSSMGPGWYNTGDVVEMDSEGYIEILGRLRRFAKIAGEMVSLELTERIATAASPAREHAATCIAHPARGETIVLFTEDPSLRREAMHRAARDLGLPEIAVARRIEYLAPIPRLATGKCDYVALKTLAEAGAEAVPLEGVR
jgi:acyl-[acyl-carrier-protein]-phospholipid O-acyltransferase/long-chain-fatty-acid--[acyl-carrier-protein] ligase